jgi:hypothetical protein
LLADRSKSLGDSVHDGDEIDDEEDAVDPEVLVDVEPADAERKAKMLAAAKHVIMARAQRKLFQTAMKQAREDSLSEDASNVTEQFQRSHVFVGDCCQKLELPSFCSQQPGDTCCLSPLIVNCFGAGDCSNTKDHLRACVCHEGEGKCGGNNVPSLVLETLAE